MAKRSRSFAAVILIVLSALVPAACAGKSARILVVPSPAPSPAAVSRTLTDDLNRRVEVRGTPQRIVALSPATVEILFSLGVTPVGRPSSADYPEPARQVAIIGTLQRPNYERIGELKPDLIIGNAPSHDERTSKLESLGAPVALFNTASFSDVIRSTKAIGLMANREAEAQRASKAVEDKLAAIKRKVPAERPSVLILMGSGKVFYSALSASYVGGLAKELGATNIAAGPEDKRYRGFTLCSLEKLLDKDPDVIIAIRPSNSPDRAPSVLPTLETDERWLDWKTAKARRVHEVAPLLYLQNPGLRVGDALFELAAILYPRSFPGGRQP